MANAGPFTTLAEFVFNVPLYSRCDLSANWDEGQRFFKTGFRVDGHCLWCGQLSTFQKVGGGELSPSAKVSIEFLAQKYATYDVTIACARDPDHKIQLFVKVAVDVIVKIGQYPSLADIANDESKAYRKVLSVTDSLELHKAIGLAAHGVGIGSYVYLRRIFERLINGRFRDFKDKEGWNEREFLEKRMVDRIEQLKDHLPPFLVENKRVYSILSQGIHELSEQQTLAFFGVLKMSIIMILREDEEKRRELELKEEMKKAISAYAPDDDKPNR